MRLFPENIDGILLLGRKSCIWNVKFKIYWVTKSIPAAKSQNFVDILGAQKLTLAKFLDFVFFFLPEKTRLCRHYENKNQLGVTSSSYINLTKKLFLKLNLFHKFCPCGFLCSWNVDKILRFCSWYGFWHLKNFELNVPNAWFSLKQ